MPGLFVSHSSKDKNFVRRLSIDLLNAGFPVWLDEWELEVGSSLSNRIYAGIDDSTFFIVVVSTNSIESGWVNKELTGALAKEEQLNRKFIIPIRLDACQFPLQIADRLYSDFSKGYLGALESLSAVLRRNNIHKIFVPPEKRLIPLSFRRGIYLDADALRDRIESLAKDSPQDFELSRYQFVFSPDEEYQKLRQRLTERMDNIEKDRYYSPSFLETFTTSYRHILSLENYLLEGLAWILNETVFKRRIHIYDYADACKWYALLLRSNILYALWSAQDPSLPDVLSYGSDCIQGWGSDPRIYGVMQMKKVYIGLAARGEWDSEDYFSVHIDANESIHRDILYEERIPLRTSLTSVSPRWVFSKYIIPQMVVKYFLSTRIQSPVSWDFEDFDVVPDV